MVGKVRVARGPEIKSGVRGCECFFWWVALRAVGERAWVSGMVVVVEEEEGEVGSKYSVTASADWKMDDWIDWMRMSRA